MFKLNIISKYIVCKQLIIFAACCLLSACLGGTVAQQIVRSIATSVADKAMARALDVEDGPTNRQSGSSNSAYSSGTYAKNSQNTQIANQNSSIPQPYKPASVAPQSEEAIAKQNLQNYNNAKHSLENTPVDPFMLAMANSAFKEIPNDLKPIAEPLPTEEAVEVESAVEVIQTNQLVRVELFNLLIGDEKNAVYEQARLIGAASLPKKREWSQWRVGTGATLPDKKVITFLIPPEFGKLPSGTVAVVELASPGELNVARYKAN